MSNPEQPARLGQKKRHCHTAVHRLCAFLSRISAYKAAAGRPQDHIHTSRLLGVHRPCKSPETHRAMRDGLMRGVHDYSGHCMHKYCHRTHEWPTHALVSWVTVNTRSISSPGLDWTSRVGVAHLHDMRKTHLARSTCRSGTR